MFGASCGSRAEAEHHQRPPESLPGDRDEQIVQQDDGLAADDDGAALGCGPVAEVADDRDEAPCRVERKAEDRESRDDVEEDVEGGEALQVRPEPEGRGAAAVCGRRRGGQGWPHVHVGGQGPRCAPEQGTWESRRGVNRMSVRVTY